VRHPQWCEGWVARWCPCFDLETGTRATARLRPAVAWHLDCKAKLSNVLKIIENAGHDLYAHNLAEAAKLNLTILHRRGPQAVAQQPTHEATIMAPESEICTAGQQDHRVGIGDRGTTRRRSASRNRHDATKWPGTQAPIRPACALDFWTAREPSRLAEPSVRKLHPISWAKGGLTLFISRRVLWAMGALMLAECGADTHLSDTVSDAGTNSIADTHRAEGDVDDGAAAALGCLNSPAWLGEPSDPRSVCAVRCTSATDGGSDVTISIDQFSTTSGLDADANIRFTAHVVQSTPVAVDEMFRSVGAWWSGDFFNFEGSNSAWGFHLLTDGARTVSGGDLYVGDRVTTSSPFPPNLACVIYRN
jgi:hypothetical protein